MPDLAVGADVWALLKIKVNVELCNQPVGSGLKIL